MKSQMELQSKQRRDHKLNSLELWLHIKRNGDAMYGSMRTPVFSCPIPFVNLAELLLKANQIFDAIGLPQRMAEKRSINGEERFTIPDWVAANLKESTDAGESVKDTLVRHNADEFPFYVRVYQRQNFSWQGELLCLRRMRRVYFRSALELLEILTGAMGGLQGNPGAPIAI